MEKASTPLADEIPMKPGQIMVCDGSKLYMARTDGMTGLCSTDLTVPEGKEGGFAINLLY
jgi:hypothetical protein